MQFEAILSKNLLVIVDTTITKDGTKPRAGPKFMSRVVEQISELVYGIRKATLT